MFIYKVSPPDGVFESRNILVKRVGDGSIGEKKGRWEIRKFQVAKNSRNRLCEKPYLGVGRLDEINVGDGRLRPPISGF